MSDHLLLPEPQLFLEVSDVRLERVSPGAPNLIVDTENLGAVQIYRAFPLSDEDRYISFFDSRDTYLGMIKDPTGLDSESMEILREELSWRYFTPQITRLDRVENTAGRTFIEGDTDRGYMSVSFSGMREHMVEASADRFIITDNHGNRFEIKDLEKLDRRSRKYIRRMI